jgi:CRISPR-associated protein Cmr4
VRSLRGSYVYATCPTALNRLARLLTIAGVRTTWNVPEVPRGHAVLIENSDLATSGRLVLEAYAFESVRDTGALAAVAGWLAEHAVPTAGGTYFRDKVRRHTVLLNDDRFNYFVRNATLVEPHVRIDDDTGAADDGGLFYAENVPPESLFVSLVMASGERRNGNGRRAADAMLGMLRSFAGRVLQVGGDATTGRGQVVPRFHPEVQA